MRKPTLSPSKLTTFLACPVKYRWTFVDPRGKWYLRSKSYYSFGTTLHRVLEQFHDSGNTGVTTTSDVVAAYEESWIDAGFNSAEEMAEAYHEGKQILEEHVASTHRRPSRAKVLFVEKQLKMEFDQFVLVGRIDRVDEHEDGTLEIVDYKSGREDVCEEDVATDIAMACYQLLLRQKYPDRPIKATLFALRSGQEASYSMSAEELAEFESALHDLSHRLLADKDEWYDFTARYKPLCRGCDFLPLCRDQIDFAEQLEAASQSL